MASVTLLTDMEVSAEALAVRNGVCAKWERLRAVVAFGARAQTMSDEIYTALLPVFAMAMQTNRIVTGLQVPVDEVFLK